MTRANSNAPIWIVAGTRPEVIKLAPVYKAARARFGNEAVRWVSTGQHMALEDETLARFDITPAHRLAERDPDGTFIDFNLDIVRGLSDLQIARRPSLVIVQGDTVSTFAGAYAAFHARIPVAHIEAGLRTGNINDPFPEESYRRMTDAMAALHFPPTQGAADNLRAEGYTDDTIFTTGNTGIDALSAIDQMADGEGVLGDLGIPTTGRLLFVTAHRRESWGRPLEELCSAIRDIALTHPDVHVVLPLHVNPVVRNTVKSVLAGVPHVTLTPPLDYVACHAIIRRSYLIMTDSGGIAEEAPSYGVPVLILRKFTERPEAVQAGMARLTGTDRDTVLREARAILDDPALHARMSQGSNPYGDGGASHRIVLGIDRFLSGETPILSHDEQFW